ncbi:MAG: chorismate dehydratase [Saprospiraceae bacterium]|jgi:chorismate dehydratase
MKKLKVTAVSYLNTKPFLYGLLNNPIQHEIEISLDIPSVCADKLKSGEADLGLVPVAVIPHLKTPYILSDYCIGAEGAVKTVGIFSDSPIHEVKELILDYHSRTSVELAKILLDKYWKVQPKLTQATPGFEKTLKKGQAAVVIGDRTIELFDFYKYRYDLGEAWTAHTGLPFVFAAWVSNKPLAPEFIAQFNSALKSGLDHIPQLIYLLPTPVKGFDLEKYFNHYISYTLDGEKRRALARFLKEMNSTLQPTLMESLAL